jgi:hypothetical protein
MVRYGREERTSPIFGTSRGGEAFEIYMDSHEEKRDYIRLGDLRVFLQLWISHEKSTVWNSSETRQK